MKMEKLTLLMSVFKSMDNENKSGGIMNKKIIGSVAATFFVQQIINCFNKYQHNFERKYK